MTTDRETGERVSVARADVEAAIAHLNHDVLCLPNRDEKVSDRCVFEDCDNERHPNCGQWVSRIGVHPVVARLREALTLGAVRD